MRISGHPKYELVKEIGAGNFGIVRLERNKATGELVAIKYIERGERVTSAVGREIVCHRLLRHPHIVLFRELLLTSTHLLLVMEYAAGGELFGRILKAGRFREDEARYYFQQLIAAVSFCHSQHVCHRDLKLENVLLDESTAPRLKICDFGYSKSGHHHSAPRTAVGTPAYIAPEVFAQKEYDGRAADVWSCGVTLYTMLVGAYPFDDVSSPGDFRKAIVKIISADFNPIPAELGVSAECQDLLRRIFVSQPAYRISVSDLAAHPWFRKNFPSDLQMGAAGALPHPQELQSLDEINRLIEEARLLATVPAAAPAAPPPQDSAYMSNHEEPEDDYMYYI